MSDWQCLTLVRSNKRSQNEDVEEYIDSFLGRKLSSLLSLLLNLQIGYLVCDTVDLWLMFVLLLLLSL